MEKTFENNNEAAETKRFYLQQKSTRKECNYGYKNCSTCKAKDCTIRQFVE